MKAHVLSTALDGAKELEFRTLAGFNDGQVGLFRCAAGMSPWERHPTSDELLHVLEGEVEIILMTEDGPVRTELRAGSLCVVPRGLWHRHNVRTHLVEIYVTPGIVEHSMAADPRTER